MTLPPLSEIPKSLLLVIIVGNILLASIIIVWTIHAIMLAPPEKGLTKEEPTKWECVDVCSSQLERYPIPGGWMYRSAGSWDIVFVPDNGGGRMEDE